MRNKKGITLIALVITIIVLLVLAGVSLSLVLGDNGILNKAQNATEAHRTATAEEEIAMAWGSLESDYLSAWTNNSSTTRGSIFTKANIEKYLEGTVDEFKYNENGTGSITYKSNYSTKPNSEEFIIDANGKVTKAEKWIDNGDFTWTNSITGDKIQIGDVVNYDELSNGVNSYIADTTKGIGGSLYNYTNYRYPLAAKTYSTENLTWRVLGINESGQIELISENPTSERVALANEEAVIHGESILNEMCDFLYGKGMYAEYARSLNVDDIDKLAGISEEADKKALESIYGKKWQCRFPTVDEVTGTRRRQYRFENDSGYGSWSNINDSSNNYQTFRMPGESKVINAENPGYSPELTYMYYGYKLSDKINKAATDGKSIADLLSKGTSNRYIGQWLASPIVTAVTYNASFGFRYLWEGNLGWEAMWSSNDRSTSSNRDVFIRPVVVLSSDVKLSGNSSIGWSIE